MNFAIAASTPTPPTAVTPAAALEHRKLTEAAQQFEGMLLQEMLKPMKDKQDGDDTTEDKKSGEGDTLSSYGVETMATAIAKAGGLGIAKHVVAQVEGEKLSHTQQREPSISARIPK